MAEEQKTTASSNMTIEELDRLLILYKLNRLDGIHNTLVERISKAEKATDEEKEELEKQLKEVKESDSRGDNVLQKALDEKLERIKQELTVFDDKINVENIKNIQNVVQVKLQHLKFFGC
jgi:hypothetical protein